jgi:hypothetical protein
MAAILKTLINKRLKLKARLRAEILIIVKSRFYMRCRRHRVYEIGVCQPPTNGHSTA